MPRPAQSPFPVDALSWIVPQRTARVLAVGRTSGPIAQRLRALGHTVAAIHSSERGTSELAQRLPGSVAAVAVPEALPFAPYSFDAALCVQNFHEFAPGLALVELARVLREGGDLAVVYVTRDDTVPWVRRFMAMMREADPAAMPGEYGHQSLDVVEASHYFPDVARRTFRQWVPISRINLLEMVAHSPTARRLDPENLNALVTEVGSLYDNSARAPEPLLLPYRIECVRARVDHTQLTRPIEVSDDALQISLGGPS